MERLRKNKGITLIALVITIIVLLILAGVTINLTLGENGIFTTAQKAAKNYTDAQEKELADIDEFNNQINEVLGNLENSNNGETNTPPTEGLPENTPTTPSGTQVKKPADKTWDETKINSYADGAGNTIPVPVGFGPITTSDQGTKITGFVIKDISVDSEGNPTETNGNEFVWVPVEGMSYTYNRYALLSSQPEDALDAGSNSMKIELSSGDSYYFTEKMPNDEQTSVATYGGYYIGRYETGIEGATLSSTDCDGTTWTGYTGGTLVIQSGKQVWNYITRDRAKTEAEGLYNKTDDNVSSKLCSSYTWDTALKFMESTGSTYPTNSVGGYYRQSSPTTTGYDTTHPCNIYDMGGNVYEWTTESHNRVSHTCTLRGGYYNFSASDYPAAHRNYACTTDAGGYIGFRVALFM